MWLLSQSEQVRRHFSRSIGTPENRKMDADHGGSRGTLMFDGAHCRCGPDTDLTKTVLLICRFPPKVSAISVQ